MSDGRGPRLPAFWGGQDAWHSSSSAPMHDGRTMAALAAPERRAAGQEQPPRLRHYLATFAISVAVGVPTIYPMLFVHLCLIILVWAPLGVTDPIYGTDDGTDLYVTVLTVAAFLVLLAVGVAALLSRVACRCRRGLLWWAVCLAGVSLPWVAALVVL